MYNGRDFVKLFLIEIIEYEFEWKRKTPFEINNTYESIVRILFGRRV